MVSRGVVFVSPVSWHWAKSDGIGCCPSGGHLVGGAAPPSLARNGRRCGSWRSFVLVVQVDSGAGNGRPTIRFFWLTVRLVRRFAVRVARPLTVRRTRRGPPVGRSASVDARNSDDNRVWAHLGRRLIRFDDRLGFRQTYRVINLRDRNGA